MSKLVIFIFVGVCVMAVHMAPADTGTEESAKKNRDKVTAFGDQVEAKVREKNPGFQWNSWWTEAQPILKVIAEVIPANEKNKDELCKDDDDSTIMISNGPKIQEKVRKIIKNEKFNFNPWYEAAKPILKVIGEVALPEEVKKYCEEKKKQKS